MKHNEATQDDKIKLIAIQEKAQESRIRKAMVTTEIE